MDVTTAARVKALWVESGSTNDAVIATMIAGVSARLGPMLARHLEGVERTEYYDVPLFSRRISLQGFPTTDIDAVKYSNTGDWASVTAMDSDLYAVEETTGILRFFQSMSLERGELQVVYTGGMAANTTAFITAYPDISDAADMDIVAMLARRMNPGGPTTFSGGSVGGAKDGGGEVGDLRALTEAISLRRRPIL